MYDDTSDSDISDQSSDENNEESDNDDDSRSRVNDVDGVYNYACDVLF